MAKLILLRHLQSEWNKANKFTGWTDVALSPLGRAEAPVVAKKILGEKIDQVFTSPLIRNKETTELILENLQLENLPMTVDKALDERNYGEWQGLDKDEVRAKFGEEEYRARRRGWDSAPPAGESLRDVFNRAVPFFQNFIEPHLKLDEGVLIVASHNSLRALIKYLENIPDEKIADLEIPSGGIVIYNLDESLKILDKKVL